MFVFLPKFKLWFSFGTKSQDKLDGKDCHYYYSSILHVKKVDRTCALPDAVLRNVFLDVVAVTSPPSSPLIEPHPLCAPHVLSQVCLRWRKLVLDTPEIWSSIYIRNTLPPALLGLWLDRSGKEPLKIRMHAEYVNQMVPPRLDVDSDTLVEGPPSFEPLQSMTIAQSWDLLVTEIHRWDEVNLIADQHAASSLSILELNKAFTLQHLSIHLDYRGDHPGIDILDSFLYHMTSSGRPFKLSWESTPLPTLVYHPIWTCLVEIDITMGLTMDECIRFLAQCIEAEEISLGCITNDWIGDMDNEHERQLEAMWRERYSQLDWGYPVSRHVLPKLRKLSIGLDGSACDCTLILQFFTLPSLQALEFQNMRSSMDSLRNLKDLLQRSACSNPEAGFEGIELESLRIVDHFMGQDILLPILSLKNPRGDFIPAVSIYTRRGVRMGLLESALEAIAEPFVAVNLECYQDASGGTWVGRGGGLANPHLIS